MRVLLFDSTAYYPSSPLFLEALNRLSQESLGRLQYVFVDEAKFRRGSGALLNRAANRVLRRPSVDLKGLNSELLRQVRSFAPEIVLIAKGAFLTPATLAVVKAESDAVMINYATDDPFNPRVSTQYMRDSIPFYDVYACTKLAIMDDVNRAGCVCVAYVPFAYKPEVHFPERSATEAERRKFESDVAFIGGCDEDRAPFFTRLLAAIPSLNLALYGSNWDRWPSLRRYWRGFAVGRDFRLALGETKVAINLVRRANRDDHVMRTFEIPACGAFMLAERTDTHVAHFGEARAAAYFDSPSEMIARVEYFLNDASARNMIRQHGLRVVAGRDTYYERLRTIMEIAETTGLRQACASRVLESP